MGARRRWFAFRFAFVFLALAYGFGSLLSCSNRSLNPSDEQLRAKAAQATARAKQQSKEAFQDARIAAANAERKVNDIAAGVQQGMKNNQPAKGARMDINTASEVQLASLPGISRAKARQIEEHRPYTEPRQLVTRRLLTEREFAAISPQVTAR